MDSGAAQGRSRGARATRRRHGGVREREAHDRVGCRDASERITDSARRCASFSRSLMVIRTKGRSSSCAHSSISVVLPYPAGAATTITPASISASLGSRPTRRTAPGGSPAARERCPQPFGTSRLKVFGTKVIRVRRAPRPPRRRFRHSRHVPPSAPGHRQQVDVARVRSGVSRTIGRFAPEWPWFAAYRRPAGPVTTGPKVPYRCVGSTIVPPSCTHCSSIRPVGRSRIHGSGAPAVVRCPRSTD